MATTDAKSNYLENKVLDHALGTTTFTKPTTVYLALYTSSPTDADSGTEVTGGSYARQTIAFNAASGGTTSNSATVTFTSMPACTVTHFGLRDASTGGNLLYWAAFDASKSPESGDTLTIAAGGITVTEG